MTAAVECTMLDLIQALQTITDDDQEVVATVLSLVNSGRVRLCGNFAGAKIELPPSPAPAQERGWLALRDLQAATR